MSPILTPAGLRLLSPVLAVGLLGVHLPPQEEVPPEAVHLRDEVIVQSGTLRNLLL